MNQDIVEINDGFDLGLAATEVCKAGNVVNVQLGSLEYAPDFGVDQRAFLDSELRFPNQSYAAYLVQRLCESDINVAGVTSVKSTLMETLTFKVGSTDASDGGLIL